MTHPACAALERPRRSRWILLAAATLATLVAGVALGGVRVAPAELIAALTGGGPAVAREIVWTLRMPRVLLAALVGAALGVSGGVLQGALRNPLAEPYLLGVSGGAAVGAVLATAARAAQELIPLAAFAGGAASVVLALAVARGVAAGAPDGRTLIMAGVVIGALANAAIMIVLATTPADAMRGALWWMMGSVGDATWPAVAWLAGYVAMGAAALLRIAPELDALPLGDDAAAALGVNVEAVTRWAFLAGALLAGATVAAAGLVGFVGLIVPHLARAGGATRARSMIAAAALIGAGLTVLADIIARTAAPPSELPLGAVTAVLGVPFFLWRLARER